MRKILIALIFVLLFWINNGFSAWYWNFSQIISGSITWCSTDWDTTWWSPSFSKSPLSWSYSYDSKVVNSSWNTIYCQRWDWSVPQNLSVSYTSGWTKSSKTITVKAKDTGWSKLKKIILQQSQNWVTWINTLGF